MTKRLPKIGSMTDETFIVAPQKEMPGGLGIGRWMLLRQGMCGTECVWR